MTHADKTTRGSGLREQELWKSVLFTGKERWKKQRHAASHKSQHRIDTLHPALGSQNQTYARSQQEAAQRVKRGQGPLEMGKQWKVNSL